MAKNTVERVVPNENLEAEELQGYVEQGYTHRVTIGLKMPIPHIDYSNINIELACEGPDRELLIEETKSRIYELMEEVLGDFADNWPATSK